jgi:ribosome-associated heat shock protein Hsp15
VFCDLLLRVDLLARMGGNTPSSMSRDKSTDEGGGGVRLDKWLWAARFYKTRVLAHAAIEAGRVFVDELCAKPGRKIVVGQRIRIRHPSGDFLITVEKLALQRVSASIAATFYREDEESKRRREHVSELRRMSRIDAPAERPNTQDRNLLRRLKQGCGEK